MGVGHLLEAHLWGWATYCPCESKEAFYLYATSLPKRVGHLLVRVVQSLVNAEVVRSKGPFRFEYQAFMVTVQIALRLSHVSQEVLRYSSKTNNDILLLRRWCTFKRRF